MTTTGADFRIVPGGEPIPRKIWARATDILADYCRAGEAFAAAGRPRDGAIAKTFDKAEADYNRMADSIWFARWSQEQMEEWERIAG